MAHEQAVAQDEQDDEREEHVPEVALIRYVHAYYVECGVVPIFRKVCKGTGLKLKDVYALFPPRPIAVACRIAGLPKP